MKEINFFALGGQDEKGKNIFCIEIENEIYIFDCGLKYPEKTQLGIDQVVPNFTYLKENENKIKGVFLSNPSIYNAGGIGNLLKELPNVTVYCSEIAVDLLRERITKQKIKHNASSYKTIKNKDVIKFANAEIHVFKATASFPNTYGFAIVTDQGTIVYMGDYMIQANSEYSFEADTLWVNGLSKQGVLAFISDSEYAERIDFTMPNHRIQKYIKGPMKDLSSRLIIGIFEEDIYKVYEIIKEAKDAGRKVAVYGKTMFNIVNSKLVQTDLDLQPGDIIQTSEIEKYPNCVVIINGTGDALYSRLEKMANESEDFISFNEKDFIILATPPIAGVEKRHAQALDELARTNARVMSLSDRTLWTMRASFEDIKLMTHIFRPRYFIPIKGLFKNFLLAEKAAIEAGVDEKNTLLISNGQLLKANNGKIVFGNKKIKAGDSFVNAIGAGGVSSIVINERHQLAANGVLVMGVNIDYKTKQIVSLIDIQMRGLIYVFEDSPIFKLTQKLVADEIFIAASEFKKNPKNFSLDEIKKSLQFKIGTIVKQETGKKPIVLIAINEIDESKHYNPKPMSNNNKK